MTNSGCLLQQGPDSSTTLVNLGYTSPAALLELPVTDFPRHGCVFVMMFVTAELMGAAPMEAHFGTKPALAACKDTSECFQYIVEKAEPSGEQVLIYWKMRLLPLITKQTFGESFNPALRYSRTVDFTICTHPGASLRQL